MSIIRIKYHKNMFRKKKDLCRLKTVTKPFFPTVPPPGGTLSSSEIQKLPGLAWRRVAGLNQVWNLVRWGLDEQGSRVCNPNPNLSPWISHFLSILVPPLPPAWQMSPWWSGQHCPGQQFDRLQALPFTSTGKPDQNRTIDPDASGKVLVSTVPTERTNPGSRMTKKSWIYGSFHDAAVLQSGAGRTAVLVRLSSCSTNVKADGEPSRFHIPLPAFSLRARHDIFNAWTGSSHATFPTKAAVCHSCEVRKLPVYAHGEHAYINNNPRKTTLHACHQNGGHEWIMLNK